MTVSTTINSLLLTFGSIIATYQGFNLKEYHAYPGCFFGALAFLLTQIAKIIILAILVPIFIHSDDLVDDSEEKSFIFAQDLLKAVVGMVDLIGLYILFNSKRLVNILGDIDVKIMAIGLGWAAAELLSHNFLNIFFQAWSNEMKTEYIVQAISANFDLLEILSLSTLAYLLTKKDESGTKNLVIYIIALVRYLLPVGLNLAKEMHLLGNHDDHGCQECTALAVKAAFAVTFYMISRMMK